LHFLKTVKGLESLSPPIVFNRAAKKGPDTEVTEFGFKNRGSMAYIGSWEAVVDMTPVHQKATEGGHLAWFFWR
jgi:NADH dehydrogenase FAD-containing subunit